MKSEREGKRENKWGPQEHFIRILEGRYYFVLCFKKEMYFIKFSDFKLANLKTDGYPIKSV